MYKEKINAHPNWGSQNKIQKYIFDNIGFDLDCANSDTQNLNIFLLIAIIWIGVLLF